MDNVQSFSHRSDLYARNRPQYPKELFARLSGLLEARENAWDCATGNGQAALVCAEFFEHIEATDISAEQIQQAIPHPRVKYSLSPAEKTSFKNHMFDMVVAAQAIHWFDLDSFYNEARRVLKPAGLIAVTGYAFPALEREMDGIMKRVLLEAIDPFWAEGNRMIMSGYDKLPFPFEEVPLSESFAIEVEWTLAQFLDYLRTWSAVKRFVKERGVDPTLNLQKEFEPIWGNADATRLVTMPLFTRVGRV